MAFLGSVGKFFSGAAHNPVVQAVFPLTAVTSLLASRAVQSGLHKLSQFENGPSASSQDHALQNYSPYQTYPVNYPYSGGYQSWDYSTPSPGFSTQPVATPVQDYYLQQVPSSQTYLPPGWFP